MKNETSIISFFVVAAINVNANFHEIKICFLPSGDSCEISSDMYSTDDFVVNVTGGGDVMVVVDRRGG